MKARVQKKNKSSSRTATVVPQTAPSARLMVTDRRRLGFPQIHSRSVADPDAGVVSWMVRAQMEKRRGRAGLERGQRRRRRARGRRRRRRSGCEGGTQMGRRRGLVFSFCEMRIGLNRWSSRGKRQMRGSQC
jgi:hypothetical protein